MDKVIEAARELIKATREYQRAYYLGGGGRQASDDFDPIAWAQGVVDCDMIMADACRTLEKALADFDAGGTVQLLAADVP